ncbi:uncharacterized protein A1O9_03154 [Exophiala aquamarina CBS 119918]|uniref:Uncharacterized protein n=1 Tax=Exophiala aquamarina CBS 119918 TaxID=1182545 RepID=A0A072PNW3_9EURO|nr:uncharacterized protein A1O9_03154 [Exophiala aquamarina CBS 119918]KEF61586.1 hypothetical protein A1O9_03154 [Exophiala aquamarina CBS 119918]
MATSAYAQSQDQVQQMIALVKTLTVEKLKTLLRAENLTVGGVKSELQIRTIARRTASQFLFRSLLLTKSLPDIEKLRNAGDQAGLSRVRGNIRGLPSIYASSTYPSPYSPHTSTSSASPSYSSPVPHPSYNMPGSFSMSNRITFKNSPFYTITRSLTNTLECKAREATRDTARLTVTLSPQQADQLSQDSSCKVMVFCAAEGFQPLSRESDIAFPHNVELKCNSDEVKANLRGLKNKPGSTRPADITHLIRKKGNYPNTVEMVYALTTKKFYLVVNLVQQKSIGTMVTELRHGKVISKEQVLREMRSKAEDPDEIVATSSVLSLKDPVAYTRIVTPCRSIGCNHNQCFDAASYLQLQEQAPTWTCPICSKPAPWENLALDQYVNDILSSTSRDTEAVTVTPDGRWHPQKDDDGSSRRGNPTPSDDDDDDDLVEIRDGPYARPNVETLTPHSVRTPPLSSREDSRAPSTSAPRSNKRSREDVIDLTLSDDEDVPAPKVQRTTSPSETTRIRPPDSRYHFQLPPPNPSSSFNFDKVHPSF